MNIFVGNLLFEVTGADVKKLFEGFGNVASAEIAMNKDKKAPKSRGFGFVQMPDEQQALAAIAALNGKKFMRRVLKVNPERPNPTGVALPRSIKEGANPIGIGIPRSINPTRVGLPTPLKEGPKIEAHRKSEFKKKMQPKFEAVAEQYFQEETEQKKTWFSPVFNKPGTYRGGRRTRSYMSRRGLAGMQEETKPRKRSEDNPMRWRKKKNKPRSWQKSPGEHKPWDKVEGGARPWKKAEGESKPWRKSDGGIKPRKKPAGDAKSWSKSSGHPQKSGFNPSISLGMVRGNGERPSTTLGTSPEFIEGRSRTKGRKNPVGYKR